MSFTLRYLRHYSIYKNTSLLNRFDNTLRVQCKTFKKISSSETLRPSWKLLSITTLVGFGIGGVYTYNKMQNRRRIPILNSGSGERSVILKDLPDVKVSRRITYPNDSSGLDLILFQYPTCPFCCKVRAFLDYHGLSYSVVEVNPVFRQQITWSDYKKVPILLVKVPEGYMQLNDSSMIVSALTSYFHDKNKSIKEIANYYPAIAFSDGGGSIKKEILNRYFLMYQDTLPTETDKDTIVEERKWRKWADDVLVHTLSPNVYRNRKEAFQAFKWFSEVGEWQKLFSAWENFVIVYVGAIAMMIISERLKKKYHLKDDVRLSLYEEGSLWMREVRQKGRKFHGGTKPDLADLAVYGVLNSIEGCTAFADLMKNNTKLKPWYNAMKKLVKTQAGSIDIGI